MRKPRNIYQNARVRAGLTQEAAAERLCCTPETIRAFESGRRRPSDDTVCLMAEVYGDLLLGYQHLKTGALAPLLPDLMERSLQEGTIRLFRMLHRFARQERIEKLLEIAEDGVIDAQERPVYNAIMDELREIVETVLAISYSQEGQEKTPYRIAVR